MRIDIVTIFPDYLAPLNQSLLGKAAERGLVQVRVHDLRMWTSDVHRTVDDAPYGGGPGMVMLAEPWGRALDELISHAAPEQVQPRLIVPTPTGRPFTQTMAHDYAAKKWLIFACGRYEGIDQRAIDYATTQLPVDEVSIGNYVLAGGEAATLVLVEAITRLIPGVLGNVHSAVEESFSDGLLEAPTYTRPAVWRGFEVPSVLLSGDHGAVAAWRRQQSLARTAQRRPDLIDPNGSAISEEGSPTA